MALEGPAQWLGRVGTQHCRGTGQAWGRMAKRCCPPATSANRGSELRGPPTKGKGSQASFRGKDTNWGSEAMFTEGSNSVAAAGEGPGDVLLRNVRQAGNGHVPLKPAPAPPLRPRLTLTNPFGRPPADSTLTHRNGVTARMTGSPACAPSLDHQRHRPANLEARDLAVNLGFSHI